MIFDEYIPIGNKCLSTSAIKDSGLRKRGFPLDWVMVTPFQVLELIKIGFEGWYPLDMTDTYRNKHGIPFEHFHKKTHKDNHEAMQRRIKRLYDAFSEKNHICFVYTTEAYILHSYYRDLEKSHYYGLIDLINYLKEKYPNFNFHILAVHTNVTHTDSDSENIINITLNVPPSWITNGGDNNYTDRYRDTVTQIVKKTAETCSKNAIRSQYLIDNQGNLK